MRTTGARWRDIAHRRSAPDANRAPHPSRSVPALPFAARREEQSRCRQRSQRTAGRQPAARNPRPPRSTSRFRRGASCRVQTMNSPAHAPRRQSTCPSRWLPTTRPTCARTVTSRLGARTDRLSTAACASEPVQVWAEDRVACRRTGSYGSRRDPLIHLTDRWRRSQLDRAQIP